MSRFRVYGFNFRDNLDSQIISSEQSLAYDLFIIIIIAQ
jgi:hypothetical protein